MNTETEMLNNFIAKFDNLLINHNRCLNFVFSSPYQSIEEHILCWKPYAFDCDSLIKEKNSFSIITEFDVKDCTYFFMRFALDTNMERLCCGTDNGAVKVLNLNSPDPERLSTQTLKHVKCKSSVRDLSFSRCGKTLVYCCDDGTIWSWQR